jgi:putative membrane protein
VIYLNILISLVLNALALIITAYVVPGFSVTGFTSALLAALVLGLINTFIKPALVFLTAPLNFLTLGLFSFVVNAVVLWLVTLIVPGLKIESFLSALLGAVVLSIVSTILSMLLRDVEGEGKRLSKSRRR